MEKECFNLLYLKDKYISTTDTIDAIHNEFQQFSNSLTCAINRRNFLDSKSHILKLQGIIEDLRQALEFKETG